MTTTTAVHVAVGEHGTRQFPHGPTAGALSTQIRSGYSLRGGFLCQDQVTLMDDRPTDTCDSIRRF